MSKLEVEFKFEIGDLVFFRGSQHTYDSRPKQFVILEQIAQQCCGGIQLGYKLTEFGGWIPEIALTTTEPTYRPKTEESIAEQLRLVKAEREASQSYWCKITELANKSSETST